MTKDFIRIGSLVLLEFLLDVSFSFFYSLPINPFRATLISVMALLVLLGIDVLRKGLLNPYVGGISIFLAAYFGSILVQEGYLVSKSAESALIHIGILAVSYIAVNKVFQKPVTKGTIIVK